MDKPRRKYITTPCDNVFFPEIRNTSENRIVYKPIYRKYTDLLIMSCILHPTANWHKNMVNNARIITCNDITNNGFNCFNTCVRLFIENSGKGLTC